MSSTRSFGGGGSAGFDWAEEARRLDIPVEKARPLYHEAVGRAGRGDASGAEALYRRWLHDAAVPGKRTLTEQVSGLPGRSGRDGQLGPGKQTLTMLASPVMAARAAPVQPKLSLGGEPGAGAAAGGLDAHVALPPATGGAGLPGPLRAKMEAGFGTDLSEVKLHLDDTPAAIGARAYSRGADIHVAPEHYDPSSEPGQALIGHELAHYQQQRAGRVALPQGKDGAVNVDAGLEAEADAAGERVARGQPARVGGVASSAGASGVLQPKLDEAGVKAKILEVNPQWEAAKDGALQPVIAAIATYNRGETVERLQAVQAAIRSLATGKQRKYLSVLDHLGKLIEREFDRLSAQTYPDVIHAVPRGHEQRSIANEELNTAIKESLPDASDAESVMRALQTLKPHDKQGALPKIELLVAELLVAQDDERTPGLRAFLGVYQTKKDSFPTAPTMLLKIILGVLQKGKENRDSRPKITVTGAPLNVPVAPHPTLGTFMKDVEASYDVLARKSSAPPPHAVAEVDLAFLEEMRGIPDFRVMLEQGGAPPSLTGGDGRNEKVFAVGHSQAVAFEGKLSNKGGERFYGVLYPKGWVARYGVDLKAAGVGGKSAATPTDADFAKGEMIDGNQSTGNTKRVPIPSDKAFAVRAEDATPDGQVHLHLARTHMEIHGKPMSQLEFFRQSALGVVEFDGTGKVLALRMW